jgi:hypothetical protein
MLYAPGDTKYTFKPINPSASTTGQGRRKYHQQRTRTTTPDELDTDHIVDDIDAELAQLFQDDIASPLVLRHEPELAISIDPPIDNHPTDTVPPVFSLIQTTHRPTQVILVQGDVDHYHFQRYIHHFDHTLLDSLLRYVQLLLRLCTIILERSGGFKTRQPVSFTYQPQSSETVFSGLDWFMQMHIAVVWLLHAVIFQTQLFMKHANFYADDGKPQRCFNMIRRTLTLYHISRKLESIRPLPRHPLFLWASPHFSLGMFYQLEAVYADAWFAHKYHHLINTRYWLKPPCAFTAPVSPAATDTNLYDYASTRRDDMGTLWGDLQMVLGKFTQFHVHQTALHQLIQRPSRRVQLGWDVNTNWLDFLVTQRWYGLRTSVLFSCAQLLTMQSRILDAHKCVVACGEWLTEWRDIQQSLVDVHNLPWWQVWLQRWGWKVENEATGGGWFDIRYNQHAPWLRPWLWIQWARPDLAQRCLTEFGHVTNANCWMSMVKLEQLQQLVTLWTDHLTGLSHTDDRSQIVQVNMEHCCTATARVYQTTICQSTLPSSHRPQLVSYHALDLVFDMKGLGS